jgi:hypothetical protein
VFSFLGGLNYKHSKYFGFLALHFAVAIPSFRTFTPPGGANARRRHFVQNSNKK